MQNGEAGTHTVSQCGRSEATCLLSSQFQPESYGAEHPIVCLSRTFRALHSWEEGWPMVRPWLTLTGGQETLMVPKGGTEDDSEATHSRAANGLFIL